MFMHPSGAHKAKSTRSLHLPFYMHVQVIPFMLSHAKISTNRACTLDTLPSPIPPHTPCSCPVDPSSLHESSSMPPHSDHSGLPSATWCSHCCLFHGPLLEVDAARQLCKRKLTHCQSRQSQLFPELCL